MKRQTIFITLAIFALLSLACFDMIYDRQHDVSITINNRHYQAIELSAFSSEAFENLMIQQVIPSGSKKDFFKLHLNGRKFKDVCSIDIRSFTIDVNGRILSSMNSRHRTISKDHFQHGISIKQFDPPDDALQGYFLRITCNDHEFLYGFIVN